MNSYESFLENRRNIGCNSGFDPVFIPDYLFDFQKYLVEWAIRKGRGALFEDCGFGKTIQQLVWAVNVVRKTNGRVLILTPLAVASQTKKEADKFSIETVRRKDGIKSTDKIVITNYDRLHYFNPNDFIGIVCDESSILKHFTGATQKQVTRFMNKIPYRLLCTATAAPNDWTELGTSSEALGELNYSEMLKRFFTYCDDKKQKKEQKLQNIAEKHNYYGKLSFRVVQSIGQWRLKNHAMLPFWRWVSSWTRACRMPSDLGFPNGNFVLPELLENNHVIKSDAPPGGHLLTLPAIGLAAEREERKRNLTKRCENVALLVSHNDFSVIWCHYNPEGELLNKIIPGSKEIAGKTLDEEKEEIYEAFASGELKKLIIKPKIGAWGLNWQHCNHIVTFASHSYEQHYQSIRRCWRFGQKRPVTVDVVATEGEVRVINNMKRKAVQSDRMFNMLISEMNNSNKITEKDEYTSKTELPKWL